MLAVFLDSETTGLDPLVHRLVEIAFKVVDLCSGEQKSCYHAIVCQSMADWEARDEASIAINGFTWERVQSGRTISEVRQEIIAHFRMHQIMRGCAVYICQNPSFDRTFFSQIVDVLTQEQEQWPYHWLDLASMYWALHVKACQMHHLPLPEKMNLSKNAIARQLNLPEEPLPHSALNGVDHLVACYRAVVGFG